MLKILPIQRRIIPILLLVVMLNINLLPTHAAVCTVGTTHATLALALADGTCDPIVLPAGVYPGGFNINRNVTIQGAGIGVTTIQGGGNVINVNTVTVTLQGMTITGGGRGIFNFEGNLTLINSAVTGNTVADAGAGIFNSLGSVTIINSTVSYNASTAPGAALGGGIANDSGPLTITNSTIIGNSADEQGGGIFTSQAVVTITNSIISGNTAGINGGGIYLDRGTLTLGCGTQVTGNTPDDLIDAGTLIDNSGCDGGTPPTLPSGPPPPPGIYTGPAASSILIIPQPDRNGDPSLVLYLITHEGNGRMTFQLPQPDVDDDPPTTSELVYQSSDGLLSIHYVPEGHLLLTLGPVDEAGKMFSIGLCTDLTIEQVLYVREWNIYPDNPNHGGFFLIDNRGTGLCD